jgi:hypothetical protein
VTREEAHSGQIESVGTLPTPGKDATVEELKVAYRSIEASDAPEFLKDGVMMDLADRIRAHGKPKKPAPQPETKEASATAGWSRRRRSKTCSLVEKSSAGDQWLTSLVSKPRLSRSYTGAGWLVE